MNTFKKISFNIPIYLDTLLITTIALLLGAGVYLYTHQGIKAGWIEISNPYYDELCKMPLWLNMIYFIILLFGVATIFIVVLTARYTIKNKKRAKEKRIIETHYLPLLFEYLYNEYAYTDAQKKEKIKNLRLQHLSNNLKKEIINQLRETHKQTKGNMHEKTERIFHAIDLEYVVEANLSSFFLSNKLFALKAIAVFELKSYRKRVIKLTRSTNFTLRSEAIVTMIHLDRYANPIEFLFDEKYRPSLWDVNITTKTLRELDIVAIDYKRLIECKTDYVCITGLLLVRENEIYEMTDVLKARLEGASEMVANEIYLTSIQLADKPEDFKQLIDDFEHSNDKIQLEIIKRLKDAPVNDSLIQFLKGVIENKKLALKEEAMRTLFEVDYASLALYKSSENELVRTTCRHILDIKL